MQLHVFEWGDASAPPLVCLHGVSSHGRRFEQLAEERLAGRFHVLAPDLRGHGSSSWDPPWTFATHVDDLVDTFAHLGPAAWLGHSFGGRLVVELAARRPDLVDRAILLDPALHVLPPIAGYVADRERTEPVYDSVESYVDGRDDIAAVDRRRALDDMTLFVEPLPDGRVRRRTAQAAVVSIYGELATDPPPPPQAPTLLLYVPEYGLVRDDQLEQYGTARIVRVSGSHEVMWGAFDDVADAVEQFLA